MVSSPGWKKRITSSDEILDVDKEDTEIEPFPTKIVGEMDEPDLSGQLLIERKKGDS